MKSKENKLQENIKKVESWIKGGEVDMIYLADSFMNKTKQTIYIDGKWVITRPLIYTKESLWYRLKECWMVLMGKCDVVKFYEQ
jgi:hypothetical protein